MQRQMIKLQFLNWYSYIAGNLHIKNTLQNYLHLRYIYHNTIKQKLPIEEIIS